MTTTFFAAGSEVLAPGQDGYAESAATVFGAGTPDLVARPRDASRVAAAPRHAGSAGLLVSVRSGGHSPAGFAAVKRPYDPANLFRRDHNIRPA
jgi:FAD/FMN-containing dehydrogenase